MYTKIYQCKLCKEVVRDRSVSDEIKVTIELINNLENKKDLCKSNLIHYCEDGSLGVCELIGFKKEKC